MPIPTCRPLLIIVLALVVPGCRGAGRDQELDTVRSWTSTMQLAMGQRARGAVPARYAAQLRDRASEALAEADRSLASVDSTPDQRRATRSTLDSLRIAIGHLARDTR
jgi:hypothetical protein